jgi:hypothetical protein
MGERKKREKCNDTKMFTFDPSAVHLSSDGKFSPDPLTAVTVVTLSK